MARRKRRAARRSLAGLSGTKMKVAIGVGAAGLVGLVAFLLLRKKSPPEWITWEQAQQQGGAKSGQLLAIPVEQITNAVIAAGAAAGRGDPSGARIAIPGQETGVMSTNGTPYVKCPDFYESCQGKCVPTCANNKDGKNAVDSTTCQCRAYTDAELARAASRRNR